jgi:hypothetical protein
LTLFCRHNGVRSGKQVGGKQKSKGKTHLDDDGLIQRCTDLLFLIL